MNPAPTNFYTTGGTLSHDAPSYVERQADRALLDGLRAGEFCYVLTSRQMGKSSLMVRTATKLREAGVRVIALDLTAVGQNVTPEQWYDGLLAQMGRQARLEDSLEALWAANERLGPCQRFFAAIRDALVARPAESLVVFVDEIDTVRSLPFATDEFFAAIRECYNRRGEDPVFRRVTFCLLGVATPSDLIRDTRTTPFNIGRRIELHDFSEQEAAPLAQGMRPPGSPETPLLAGSSAGGAASGARQAKRLLHRILYWTGGHPYLTQRFCRAVAERAEVRGPAEVDRLCEELFFTSRAKERDDNLLFVRERLLRSETETDLPSLLELYLKVRQGKSVPDDDTSAQVSVLRLSGIAKPAQGRLAPRNRIYSRVFDRAWVDAHMPDAERRRQRAAFYRGVIRTTGIAAVVVTALAIAVVIAARQASKARRSLAHAYYSQARATRASGLAGQRYDSLRALGEARRYHTNLPALRDEAIACLALVDLKEATNGLFSLRQANRVELAPDLDVAAVAAPDGAIRLRQMRDRIEGAALATLPGFGAPVEHLRFSPRHDLLAASYGGPSTNRLVLWDWRQGLKLFEAVPGVHGDAIDFSADARKLAVGGPDGRVRVYALPRGEILSEWESKLDSGASRVAQGLRFNPAGEWLATRSLDENYLEIWSPGATQRVTRLFHADTVHDITWHPNGQSLATACRDTQVHLWDTNDFKKELKDSRRLVGHEGPVIAVAFGHQGTLLASLGSDETLRLWTLATSREVTGSLRGGSFSRLAFSADGRRLVAAGGPPAGLRVWETFGEELMLLRVEAGRGQDLRSIDFSPDNRRLLAVTGEQILFWEADAGRELGTIPVANPQAAWFSADSQQLVASTDSGLGRWALREREGSGVAGFEPNAMQRMCPELDSLGMLAPSLDRTKAAVVQQDRVVIVGLDAGGAHVLQTNNLGAHYHQLALHPQSRWLATRTGDADVLDLWDLSEAACGLPCGRLPSGRYFTFSPDGQWLALCWADEFRFYRVGAWHQPAFKIPRRIASDQHAPIAFSQSGRTVALASSRYTIELHTMPASEKGTPALLATLEGPDRIPLELLAFSPDGRCLAAAASDRPIVQLWNLALLRTGLARLRLDRDWPDSP